VLLKTFEEKHSGSQGCWKLIVKGTGEQEEGFCSRGFLFCFQRQQSLKSFTPTGRYPCGAVGIQDKYSHFIQEEIKDHNGHE
jgi:hypothetical protein